VGQIGGRTDGLAGLCCIAAFVPAFPAVHSTEQNWSTSMQASPAREHHGKKPTLTERTPRASE
jgi:hypothetical protein